MPDDCIFCRILRGELEATVLHRDALCTAFMDIQPVNPGHLLVIPNDHATYLADLPVETGAQMWRVGQRLAAAVRTSGVRCEGVNVFLADGEAAFQEVFHVHLHIIPRFKGDGFDLTFGTDYANRPARSALEEVAEQIRAAAATA